jgi:SAM-dependent methyltransferase
VPPPADGRGETDFTRKEREARARRIAEYDRYADERDAWRRKNAAYYDSIERIIRFAVDTGARVLEIGCSTGDLLAALEPALGVGVDISERSLEHARKKYPHLEFIACDAETLDAPELAGREFDFVILSDVIGLLYDVWAAFRALWRVITPRTRVIVTCYNFVWEPIMWVGERVGLKMPIAQQNWLGMQDVENLLHLNHFDVIRRGTAQPVPINVPLLAPLANRWLATLPGVEWFGLTQLLVCRPRAGGIPKLRDHSVTVVVPTRNEVGNIDDIIARTPQMGPRTELLFVDGNSDDGTVAAIEQHIKAETRPDVRLLHQGQGKGKGDAVRKGFLAAKEELLMILDADLTVPPEELPKFYLAIAEGCGEFVNGTRLVYPMEDEAMRFLNALGNKFFGEALSLVLGQRLKDTLCGTKVLLKRDYERIAAGRAFFGDFDPFGDFDLLFGAAKANLKIVEMPIRYRSRTYGDTKIQRFRNGLQLLKMTAFAHRKFREPYRG